MKMQKCARTSCQRARACFIASPRTYNSWAHIYARIFMKFQNKTHKIVIDHHIKFHKDSQLPEQKEGLLFHNCNYYLLSDTWHKLFDTFLFVTRLMLVWKCYYLPKISFISLPQCMSHNSIFLPSWASALTLTLLEADVAHLQFQLQNKFEINLT